jgi:hypothetical protein
MNIKTGRYIQINKPQYFKNKEFLKLIEDEWTWHKAGEPPNEYSDTIFYYEEGTESFEHLPAYIGEELEAICSKESLKHGLVWITNLEE